MSPDYESAKSIAQILITGRMQNGEAVTREMIAAGVDMALNANPTWRGNLVREKLVADLEASYAVWIGKSVTLEGRDDHRPWLDHKKASTEWRFWKRYRVLLQKKGWTPASLASLDELTDETLSRLEDPARSEPWDRRGLVAGHVQSGKTANYTGLICKAADAGYRVIIVLAGVHDSLRSQTQIRLDEGFLGFDSLDTGRGNGAVRARGVGTIDPGASADTITTWAEDGDFKLTVKQNFNISPGGKPLLFVVKKNARVLENLNSWVARYATSTLTTGDRNRKVVPDVPLLLIDDEADVASVDTRQQAFDDEGRPDPDHNPTSINRQIRRLLHLFERSAYVGYTATPFANIFIHEQGETAGVGEDLFPRSFITCLPAPSDYVGPARVFGLDPDPATNVEAIKPLGLVRTIRDHADTLGLDERNGWMPPIHKKEHLPRFKGDRTIPPSLRHALYAFILSCAARRARGQTQEHNSMLVHVTRFTLVQAEVFQQVKEELQRVRDHLDAGKGAGIETLQQELRELWEKDFIPTSQRIGEPDLPVMPWSTIKSHLRDAVAPIKMRQINGSVGDVLDYEQHRGTGLSVIAVGGDKLSRGLTLEGLTVSYFLRSSKMYDTLMQMGRWFGYRPGHMDLCRMYMTPDLNTWFQHITRANEELRQEFDRMARVGGTPRDFGLKVRSHPVLLVTSRVKMRHGEELQLSFAGDIVETIVFDRSERALLANYQITEGFLRGLDEKKREEGKVRSRPWGQDKWPTSYVWEGVPGQTVANYLRSLVVCPESYKANGALVAAYIEKQLTRGELIEWTVCLVGRDGGNPHSIAGLDINLTQRKRKEGSEDNRYIIPRLVNPKDEAIDLEAPEYLRAFELTKASYNPDAARSRRKKEPEMASGPYVREVRPVQRGVLLIYTIDPDAEYTGTDAAGKAILQAKTPPIGWAVSLPASKTAVKVSYQVNNVYWTQEYEAGA